MNIKVQESFLHDGRYSRVTQPTASVSGIELGLNALSFLDIIFLGHSLFELFEQVSRQSIKESESDHLNESHMVEVGQVAPRVPFFMPFPHRSSSLGTRPSWPQEWARRPRFQKSNHCATRVDEHFTFKKQHEQFFTAA